MVGLRVAEPYMACPHTLKAQPAIPPLQDPMNPHQVTLAPDASSKRDLEPSLAGGARGEGAPGGSCLKGGCTRF